MFWFLKMDKQTMKDNAPKMVFKTQYKYKFFLRFSNLEYICELVESKLIKCTERFKMCYDEIELRSLRAGMVSLLPEILKTLHIKNVSINK